MYERCERYKRYVPEEQHDASERQGSCLAYSGSHCLAAKFMSIRHLKLLRFDSFVHHSSTLAHEHGVVCSLKHLGQKHLAEAKSETFLIEEK